MEYALKANNVLAFYMYNEADKVYTVSLIGKGGPIITAATLEEAKIDFERALNLSCSVNNLLFFKKTHRQDKMMRNNFSSKISYLQVA